MKYILLYILFLIIHLEGISQNVCKINVLISDFDKKNFISDSLFLEGKYLESLAPALHNLNQFNDKINQTFISVQKETADYENTFGRVIRCYGELNKIDSAFYWLDRLNNCVKPSYQFYFYPEFNSLFYNTNYSKYYKPYIDSIKLHNKNLISDYYIQLIKLEMSQWLYMRMRFDYRFSINNDYNTYLIENQNKAKEHSLQQLDSLIILYGIPSKVQITNNGMEYIYRLVMQKNENSSVNMDLIYALYKEKIINVNQYSEMVDKSLIHMNCPQKYGTQYWFDDTIHQYFYFPIDDLQHINYTRNQIGLYPIKDQNGSIGLNEIQIKSNGIRY